MLRKMWLLVGGLVILLTIGAFGLTNRTEPISADAVTLPWDAPPPYRIVYLVAEEAVTADSPVAPSQLKATLGAQTAYSWSEVLALNNISSIDALIIHDSALPLVDRNWVSDAYRRGVVVAAFNVYAPQLAHLVNDPNVAKDGFASEPYPGLFYVSVFRLVLGQPDDVALIESAGSFGEPVAGVQHPVRITGGRSTYAINNFSDYNIFARVLISDLEAVEQAKREFETGTYFAK